MPAGPKSDPTPISRLSDDALDGLARAWFAEARTRQREELRAARRSTTAEPGTADTGGGPLDWLSGGDEDGCHADDGGDGGD